MLHCTQAGPAGDHELTEELTGLTGMPFLQVCSQSSHSLIGWTRQASSTPCPRVDAQQSSSGTLMPTCWSLLRWAPGVNEQPYGRMRGCQEILSEGTTAYARPKYQESGILCRQKVLTEDTISKFGLGALCTVSLSSSHRNVR